MGMCVPVCVAVGACVYLRMCVRLNDFFFRREVGWGGISQLGVGCCARAGYFTVEHPRL